MCVRVSCPHLSIPPEPNFETSFQEPNCLPPSFTLEFYQAMGRLTCGSLARVSRRFARMNFTLDAIGGCVEGNAEIVGALKIDPELGCAAKIAC
jgi:hypothetical protein